MSLRAQVFISCGQREDLGEMEVAANIAEVLAQEGFEPYIAASQQTLRGPKENIFQRLAESEYFLFIDFVRDRLDVEGSSLHRGSVFSQQELALAAYLDTDVIAFQEESIKPLEGILLFMQTNCLLFNDRSLLPNMVIEKVRERGWSSDWKKALTIEAEVNVHRNVRRLPEDVQADFYHLHIRNNHIREVARNVYAYLENVVEVGTNRRLEYGSVEFKWAGYTLPNAIILAGGTRRLDAFWIPHPQPNRPQFNCFTDSTAFFPRIQGPGQWYMDYSVFSDTLRGASRRFLLTLDGPVAGVSLEPA